MDSHGHRKGNRGLAERSRRCRRSVLAAVIVLLSGCLDTFASDDSEGERDENESESDGNDVAAPYDPSGTFILRARFVGENDIEDGFEVLSSNEKRFEAHRSYVELFHAVEAVPESDRRTDLGVQADDNHTLSDEEGVALLETIAAIRDEMDADWHPNDGSGRNYGTHYVEHDGSILMVYVDDGGGPV